MTREQFESKIPARIIHPSHGELYRQIAVNKDEDIIVNYVVYNSTLNLFDTRTKSSTYGTIGKSYQEVFESLYPFMVKQGHIKTQENIEKDESIWR
jgi:hypothetical protein